MDAYVHVVRCGEINIPEQDIMRLLCMLRDVWCASGSCQPNLTTVYISQLQSYLYNLQWHNTVTCVCCLSVHVSLLTCHMTQCVFCLCRDFDLQLFPDTDLFHPDFTLNTGSQTVRKHSMRSYFYSGFDRSECLFGHFCTFASSPFKGLSHQRRPLKSHSQKCRSSCYKLVSVDFIRYNRNTCSHFRSIPMNAALRFHWSLYASRTSPRILDLWHQTLMWTGRLTVRISAVCALIAQLAHSFVSIRICHFLIWTGHLSSEWFEAKSDATKLVNRSTCSGSV